MGYGARAAAALRRLAKRSKHISHTIWGAGALKAIPHLLICNDIARTYDHRGLFPSMKGKRTARQSIAARLE
jgi:hypothetical protein